ncbi:gamma-glutamyltransferase family protein [Candidatus Xianfuyuplasma coldseepsis]|uniref:Gamma-glutamyltransferase family protein n=1 Tax=Candidatus Xianfuyuplasma coldseepsis TaxID=2782163 RepID=A0A7L7KTM4_9MOLU|nr:gamma-glutamyltransferase family protein [Xianfuyuplasma coldseepsis]QMS85662.1 gamma-glutamyltransferase family protein [Xianfuyuplasma coldseepsis]
MNNPFFSKRQSVHAKNGVVATSEGLAAQAGMEILKQGGNAIDAAIATAAALTVVEPCSNGIGSDNFALVYFKDKLYGMNSSGWSSQNISIDAVKARGYDEMPAQGVIPITVPGTPKGWANLIDKFGNLSLYDCLKPAIRYAREGFAISETVGFYFEHAIKRYRDRNKTDEYKHFFDVFTKNGQLYKAGDIFQSNDLADTLEEIGKTNADSFYTGDLSKKIVSFMKQYNGFIDADDLAEFDSEFVDPIHVHYKGYDVCEIPPNGQGITALMALNILKDETLQYGDIITYHKQIEAIKIAFSDTLQYVTDPQFMKMNPEFLLSDDYVAWRKKDITDKALLHQPIDYASSGTVYLATADNEGNMVSFIQSNYMGFGSGIVIDGTGISMQNRGHTFKLDESHHNKLEPRKRTYHTIIPGFLMKDGKGVGPFGVMGGFMQPQGHLQVVMNLIDFNMNPQAALDAPRFRWDKGLEVALENSFEAYVAQKLQLKGHQIKLDVRSSGFGRGQIILKHGNHYLAGTETRCDGYIAYY